MCPELPCDPDLLKRRDLGIAGVAHGIDRALKNLAMRMKPSGPGKSLRETVFSALQPSLLLS